MSARFTVTISCPVEDSLELDLSGTIVSVSKRTKVRRDFYVGKGDELSKEFTAEVWDGMMSALERRVLEHPRE